MKTYINLILFVILLYSNNLQAQCSITDLSVTHINCYNDENFSVMIDFNYDEVGENGFTVVGNGNNYGTFSYSDLPLEFQDLAGNCLTEYEFIIRDFDNPLCLASVGIGEVCCSEDCEITIHEYAFSDCEDDEIGGEIVFNMDYFYSNEVIVETNTGFSETLPFINNSIFLSNVPATDDLIEFTFTNPNDPDCSVSLVYESTCVCNLNNLDVRIIDCDDTEESYYVRMDFESNMTSDSFLLGGNSVFTGTFAYTELPIIVGPYNFNETTDVNFLVQDSGNFFCFVGIELGVINECPAECGISDILVTPLACDDGTASLTISFDNSDANDDGFTIKIGDQVYGPFDYGEDSYTIDNINSYCLNGPNLILRDVANEDCLVEFDITDELCCTTCDFFNIETSILCHGDSSRLLYTFNHELGGDSYYVFLTNESGSVNIPYGSFPYGYDEGLDISDLPDGIYNLQFIAGNNDDCEGNAIIDIECGNNPCSVRDLTYEITDCENGEFYVELTFISSGFLGETFTIRGNGVVYGENYTYGEDNYTIGPLSADCGLIYEFVIIDGENEDCRTSIDFDEPVCCSDCDAIGEITFESLGCDENGNVTGYIYLDSITENVDSLYVQINGDSIGLFTQNNLPIEVEVSEGNNTITVSDIENCISSLVIDIECNNCLIDDLTHEVVECVNGTATISFNGRFVVGSEIDILLNGEDEGNYHSDDFPIDIDNIIAKDTTLITIVSEEYPNCNSTYIILPFDCTTGINDLESSVRIFQSGNQIIMENIHGTWEYTLYLYDGSIMSRGNIKDAIYTDHLSPSIYLLALTNEYETITKKILIK